jgi:hypothetical protein
MAKRLKKAPARKVAPASGAKEQRSRISEAKLFIRSLRKHGQLYTGNGTLPSGATHALKKRRGEVTGVERKRFSII